MGIEVRSITKRFGGAVAVEDVSLQVPTGSLTALLGPSGGGKSTLLRIMAGLEAPDRGTVVMDGRDITTVPARQRGVGFCFQHHAPFNHMTVARNIAFGLEVRRRPRAEVRAKVDELLELVHLEGLGHRYPTELSGGQRQRMALARALAIEPELLLLDEPFGSLDTQVRHELRTWLRDLHDRHPVTTVLVTHDQEEALEVSDRLAVLREGRLEQVGPPADLYDRPTSEFVLRFLGPATRLEGSWVRPHDIVLDDGPGPGSVPVTVSRLVHLGFEVRAELVVHGGKREDEVAWAQLSRRDVDRLSLREGEIRWARASGPSRVPVGAGSPDGRTAEVRPSPVAVGMAS